MSKITKEKPLYIIHVAVITMIQMSVFFGEAAGRIRPRLPSVFSHAPPSDRVQFPLKILSPEEDERDICSNIFLK